MPSAGECEAEIKKLNSTADLVALWDAILKNSQPAFWSAGKALEYLVVRAFEIEKLRVHYPYSVSLPPVRGTREQIDGYVRLGATTFLIESKDHASPVDIEPVAKLRLRLAGRPPGTMGIVFSTSDYTKQTDLICQFLQPLDVLLWGKNDFDIALRSGTMRRALKNKYEAAIRDGWPNWPLR